MGGENNNVRNKEYEYILDGQIFRWDTDKLDINKKHDVSFEEAATVFQDTRTIYIGVEPTKREKPTLRENITKFVEAETILLS